MPTETLYSTDIAGGALMLPESRKIARLLLAHPSPQQWQQAIVLDNLLQTRSPATAKRYANLIRARLERLPEPLWTIVAEGSQEAAGQVMLAGAIKHSRLLAEFMREVLPAHRQLFEPRLRSNAWEAFMEACEQRDPEVRRWFPSTRQKLRQIVMKILSEAGYIENTRSLRLQAVSLVPDVERLLTAHQETDVLACLKPAP